MTDAPIQRPLSDAADAGRFLTHPSQPPRAPLPQRYGAGLTLLVRDPHCLFAFWEAEGEDPWRLEVYATDEMGSSREWFAAWPVGPMGSRYLEVPHPGHHYVARLVSATAVYESSIVETPPAGPSPIEDESWLTLGALNRWVRTWGGASSPLSAFGVERAWSIWNAPSSHTVFQVQGDVRV